MLVVSERAVQNADARNLRSDLWQNENTESLRVRHPFLAYRAKRHYIE